MQIKKHRLHQSSLLVRCPLVHYPRGPWHTPALRPVPALRGWVPRLQQGGTRRHLHHHLLYHLQQGGAYAKGPPPPPAGPPPAGAYTKGPPPPPPLPAPIPSPVPGSGAGKGSVPQQQAVLKKKVKNFIATKEKPEPHQMPDGTMACQNPVQCMDCKGWLRSFKFGKSIKVMKNEHMHDTEPDEEEVSWHYQCAECHSKENGTTLEAAITTIAAQGSRWDRKRSADFLQARASIQEEFPFFVHVIQASEDAVAWVLPQALRTLGRPHPGQESAADRAQRVRPGA